jgi:hypothetical protein
MYCRRASSTCSLPSWLWARAAKMSRISEVRSATGTPRCCSRLRCCAGLRAWSKITPWACVAATRALISSALPEPTNSAASGALRRARPRHGQVARRLRQQREFVECWIEGHAEPPTSTPTSTARVAPSFLRGAELMRWELKVGTAGGRSTLDAGSAGSLRLVGVEVDRAARHHGGDGVLVDHLGHGVAQAARRTGRRTRCGPAA